MSDDCPDCGSHRFHRLDRNCLEQCNVSYANVCKTDLPVLLHGPIGLHWNSLPCYGIRLQWIHRMSLQVEEFLLHWYNREFSLTIYSCFSLQTAVLVFIYLLHWANLIPALAHVVFIYLLHWANVIPALAHLTLLLHVDTRIGGYRPQTIQMFPYPQFYLRLHWD